VTPVAFTVEDEYVIKCSSLSTKYETDCLSCRCQARLAGRRILFSTVSAFVHPFVHSSVTKLVNMIFWKQMNQFWCHLASTSGPGRKGMKRSTLGVRRLKVKSSRDQR